MILILLFFIRYFFSLRFFCQIFVPICRLLLAYLLAFCAHTLFTRWSHLRVLCSSTAVYDSACLLSSHFHKKRRKKENDITLRARIILKIVLEIFRHSIFAFSIASLLSNGLGAFTFFFFFLFLSACLSTRKCAWFGLQSGFSIKVNAILDISLICCSLLHRTAAHIDYRILSRVLSSSADRHAKTDKRPNGNG